MFDLAGLRPLNTAHVIPRATEAGVDGVAGYNVHSIVLQVPKSRLVANDPTIGIWSSTYRRQVKVLDERRRRADQLRSLRERVPPGHAAGERGRHPARARRTASTRPSPDDDAQFGKYVLDPELSKLIPVLYPGVTVPPKPRNDLAAIFLTGITDLNMQKHVRPAEMIRLNTSIAPTPYAQQNRLGLLAGQNDGFPNGRRLIDDVTDIELRALAGGTPFTPSLQPRPEQRADRRCRQPTTSRSSPASPTCRRPSRATTLTSRDHQMTTGMTAVGGEHSQVLPRRLALVVLIAITTFAVTRFVTFDRRRRVLGTGSGRHRRRSRRRNRRSPQLEASTRRDPQNATHVAGARRGVPPPGHRDRRPGLLQPLRPRARPGGRAGPGPADDRGRAAAHSSSLCTSSAQARELVEPITRQDPFDSDALAVLVDADVELGRYDDAATNLQHLLDLRPGLPAYSRASYLRELHGDLPGAEQAMHQALTAGAGDRFDVATVTTFLGDLAFGSGDLPDGVGALPGGAARSARPRERDSRLGSGAGGSRRRVHARSPFCNG